MPLTANTVTGFLQTLTAHQLADTQCQNALASALPNPIVIRGIALDLGEKQEPNGNFWQIKVSGIVAHSREGIETSFTCYLVWQLGESREGNVLYVNVWQNTHPVLLVP